MSFPSPSRRSILSRRRLAALPALPLALVAASSCSSSSPATTVVAPAEVVAFSRVNNLMPVSFTAAGTSGWAFIDTGNPVVELTPGIFPVAMNAEASVSITVDGQTFSNVAAYGAAQAPIDPGLPLTGNLGYGIVGGHVASFNYRDVVFTLGSAVPSPPSGVMADTTVPFMLLGGKAGNGLPASRVMVTVTIEGTSHFMQLDTGANVVTVNQAVYSALTSDGRTQLTGSSATSNGNGASSATRVRSISVGGAEVDSVVIEHRFGLRYDARR